MAKGNKRKKAMLAALEKSLGIVSAACLAVGISRKTHYEWLKEDEKYKQAVEDIDEKAVDFAESKLHQLISGVKIKEKKLFLVGDRNSKRVEEHEVEHQLPPDNVSVIFYMKTKGKKRGYVEKQEVDFNDKTIRVRTEEDEEE